MATYHQFYVGERVRLRRLDDAEVNRLPSLERMAYLSAWAALAALGISEGLRAYIVQVVGVKSLENCYWVTPVNDSDVAVRMPMAALELVQK